MISFREFFHLLEAKFRKESGGKDAVGWLKNSGEWIPVNIKAEELHDNPKYISQLEPTLEKQFQDAHPGYEYEYDDPEREELKDECIRRGHTRVAEMVGMGSVTLQARDLNTLNRAMNRLKVLFPKKMDKYEVLADINKPDGSLQSLIWDSERDRFKRLEQQDLF